MAVARLLNFAPYALNAACGERCSLCASATETVITRCLHLISKPVEFIDKKTIYELVMMEKFIWSGTSVTVNGPKAESAYPAWFLRTS